jgi:hypothetical protein
MLKVLGESCKGRVGIVISQASSNHNVSKRACSFLIVFYMVDYICMHICYRIY